jgi:beta-lactamase regulating signal transducer with metallopeptidase domain
MTPAMLAILVGLASFFACSTLLAAIVALWWRVRPVADVDRLFALRMLPAVGGLLLTLGIVAPAFVRFEPPHEGEQAGPMLLVLAACGAFAIAAGLVRATRAIVRTHELRRRWLSESSAMPAFDGAMPAHLIDVPYPVVAIIGIRRPVLVISQRVTGGCSADEVQLIAAHERAHLRARDNMKRLLIDGCPDVLRWTSTGDAIASAWAASAEDAADDAATRGDRRARIALASVLVRVARMAVGNAPAPQLVSALVGLAGVERRVRRLAGTVPSARAPRLTLRVAIGAAIAGIIAAAQSDELLSVTHSAAEIVVALGR